MSKNADYQRAYRQRLRWGVTSTRVDLSAEALEALIRTGLLHPEHVSESSSIRLAATAMIENSVKSLRGSTSFAAISSSN